jgi:hypothetical protein
MHSELDPSNPSTPAVEGAQTKPEESISKPPVAKVETQTSAKPAGGIDSMGLPRTGKSSGR